MPRKPRIHFNGAVYHVMLRGNGGHDIFFDDADRVRYLLMLQQALERYRCKVHGYCLMDNHIHLAVQVSDIPLSKLMQNISFRYTQHINRKNQRTGHLFQGRFKALLIEQDSYLLQLVRYIHLNPVRANMVKDLRHYPWSSYLSYTGEHPCCWLTTDWILEQLADGRSRAIENFRTFMNDGLSEGHCKEFHQGTFEGRALGGETFIQDALLESNQPVSLNISVDDILNYLCAEYDITISDLLTSGRQQPLPEVRALASWLVKQFNHLQLKSLGVRLKRDLSGLSQAARRIELKAKMDDELKLRLESLRNSVCQA